MEKSYQKIFNEIGEKEYLLMIKHTPEIPFWFKKLTKYFVKINCVKGVDIQEIIIILDIVGRDVVIVQDLGEE